MNVIPLIMSVFLLFSCTEQEQIISESIAEKSITKENKDILSGVNLAKLGLEDLTQNLNCRKEFYETQIEEGNEEYIDKYEKTSQQYERYSYVSEYLTGFIFPKGPGGIGPINPPNPCKVGENLEVSYRMIDISDVRGFIVPEELEFKIRFFDLEKNQLIGIANQVVDSYNEDNVVLQFESDFKGLAIAESTFIIKGEKFTTKTLVKISN